jgi:hypothetical protein
VSAVILLLLDLIALSSEAKAATLKPETIAAWDHYLQTTNANLQPGSETGLQADEIAAQFSRRTRTMLSRAVSNAARRGRREA